MGWWGLCVALFIIYGSLVPFVYRPASFAQGLYQFAHIKWLDLGIESRADWVANLVLYVPFGFFVCGALGRRRMLAAILVTAILGSVLAVGVEFAQIWAAPRTVSLNDIVAEIAGTVLGLLIWLVWGRRLTAMALAVLRGGRPALPAALSLYILVYCFVSLFPYDFLVSAAEIHRRLADPTAIVIIPRGMHSVRGIVSLVAKIALMVPLGAVLALAWRRSILVTALVAIVISGLLEIVHWFEYSEQTDLLTVLAAIAGAVSGNLLAPRLIFDSRHIVMWLRRITWIATPLYLAALPVIRGWRLARASPSQVQAIFEHVHWLPFYYHYYTSEGNALMSVVGISACFAPLGALAFGFQLQPYMPASTPRPLGPTVVVALVLAAILEIGGVLTVAHRPDPTNLLVAAVAACLAQRTCEWSMKIAEEIFAAQRSVA